MRRILSLGAFFLSLSVVFSFAAVSSPNTPQDTLSALSEKIKAACTVIEENIKKGNNIKKYVRTSIQMGYAACPVIRCSIQAGGDLEQIITGALEAGVTTEVASKCCIAAGAEPKNIAAILSSVSASNICYLLPEDQPLPQTQAPPRTLRPLSPSGF